MSRGDWCSPPGECDWTGVAVEEEMTFDKMLDLIQPFLNGPRSAEIVKNLILDFLEESEQE